MLQTIQALLTQLAVSFDLPILDWIQSTMVSPIMDRFWYTVTFFGEAGIFWIALSVLFLIIPKTRRMGLGMAIALALGLVVCNIALKPLIARPRPYDFALEHFGRDIFLLTKAQHDFSFPSGHTIASFEASVVMLKNSKRLGIPALILAILVSFSRLYLYLHYPTDVLVSIVLGTIFALIGYGLAKLIVPKSGTRKRGKYERV